MARIQTIVCDRCGVKEGAVPWSGHYGTGKVHGDLCRACWDELVELFRPSAQARGRHQIVVVDPKDIKKA